MKKGSIAVFALGLLVCSAYAHANNEGDTKGCLQAGSTHNDEDRIARHREWHEYRLHKALNLTPEQEPVWLAYLSKMNPLTPQQRPDFESLLKLPTPERLDRLQALAKERQERMAAHATATKEFYAQLSPDQQKSFDSEFMHGLMMKRMSHRMTLPTGASGAASTGSSSAK